MNKKTETAKKLGGVFKEVTAYISRKRTDGNYGSYEVGMGGTINLGPDDNPEEQVSLLDTFFTAAVATSMKDKAPKEPPVMSKQEQIMAAGPQDITPDNLPPQEPAEMKCSIHGVMMPKRTNDKGTWYSHKVDDRWCNGK